MELIKANISPLLFCTIFFLSIFFISILIPPFQSPDEGDHVKRAYLLTKFQIILDISGGISGGRVDTGLLKYISCYTKTSFSTGKKLSSDEIEFAKNIQWSGVEEFSPTPGTGYYFPVIYTPQAVGLLIGKVIGQSVDTSYKFARFFALLVSTIILFFAFNFYRPSLLVMALLAIPMTLFQFASASLDGISTALAILAISVFLRIGIEREKSSHWFLIILAISVILVAGSRVHLLPILLFLISVSFNLKSKKSFFVTIFSIVFIFIWIFTAIKTTVDPRVNIGAPVKDVIIYYLLHPYAFFEVFFSTILDLTTLTFYKNSFLGILGWLDLSFQSRIYLYLSYMLGFSAIFSFSIKDVKYNKQKILLLICCIFSVSLTFFALLVSWTPHPASIIQGIQGRYFLVPALFLTYAVCGETGVWRTRIGMGLLVVLGLFSLYNMSNIFLDRYYLVSIQPIYKQIHYDLKPSLPLEKNSPITIFMDEQQSEKPQPLSRIGINFGTYARTNTGTARLILHTNTGNDFALPFDLSALKDNQYKFFDLDDQAYSFGEIVFSTGGGVSTWEVHLGNDSILTCLAYEFSDGSKRYTKGCPSF